MISTLNSLICIIHLAFQKPGTPLLWQVLTIDLLTFTGLYGDLTGSEALDAYIKIVSI